MDKIIETLKSPVWWITVVIAGIAINVISAFLKSLLDNKLSEISTWWKNRSEKQKMIFESHAKKMAGDPQEHAFACYCSLRQRTMAILFLNLGVISMILGEYFIVIEYLYYFRILLLGIGAVTLILSQRSVLRSLIIHQTLLESQKIRQNNKKSNP